MFPSKVSKRFPGTGSQARVPSKRFPSKVPRKRFPSKVPKQGSQEEVPRQGYQVSRFPGNISQARFPGTCFSQTKQGSQNRFSSKCFQEEVSRKRCPSKVPSKLVPKQCFQEEVSKQGFPRRVFQARFSGRGSHATVRRNRLASKAAYAMFQARFQEQVPKQVVNPFLFHFPTSHPCCGTFAHVACHLT